MGDKKLKRKISISINKQILEDIENLSTNKSRLIEYILLEYLHKNNIKTDDIIL
jgi:metal-responsive CopG/Arc/MetJ family transcriptional regulator